MTGILLSWQCNRKRPLAENLAGALARYLAKFGTDATVLTVHPGELVAAPGMTIVESRSVQSGCWDLGVES